MLNEVLVFPLIVFKYYIKVHDILYNMYKIINIATTLCSIKIFVGVS